MGERFVSQWGQWYLIFYCLVYSFIFSFYVNFRAQRLVSVKLRLFLEEIRSNVLLHIMERIIPKLFRTRPCGFVRSSLVALRTQSLVVLYISPARFLPWVGRFIHTIKHCIPFLVMSYRCHIFTIFEPFENQPFGINYNFIFCSCPGQFVLVFYHTHRRKRIT